MSEIVCPLCLTKSIGQIEYQSHVRSEAHRLKYIETLTSSPTPISTKKSSESFKCEPCDKRFDGIIPYQQHNASVKHQKKLSAFTSGVSEIPTEKNKNEAKIALLYCEPCGKKFAGSVPHSQHMVSEKHLKKMRDIKINDSSPLNTTSSALLPVNFVCQLCNVQCESASMLTEHGKSSEHRINVMHAQEKNASATKSSSINTNERDLVINIMSSHKPDFIVCPANKSFAEFVLENNIFS